jgi:dTMP kinase
MYIAFEGIDGIGKRTQSRLLAKRLEAQGRRVLLTGFPRYESFFGGAVGEYLNGEFGSLEAVHPKLAALLYACDRWKARAAGENWEDYDVVIFDRYVPSNLAHQGAKADGSARDALIAWIEEMEYSVFALPRPDIVFILDAEPELALAQVLRKSPRGYTVEALDLHEKDGDYIALVREVYHRLWATGNPYCLVSCDSGEDMRGVEDISEDIWRRLLHYEAGRQGRLWQL